MERGNGNLLGKETVSVLGMEPLTSPFKNDELELDDKERPLNVPTKLKIIVAVAICEEDE
ncbi:hypothetical protein F3Y22_tig00110633pilonHSYRG00030 [Hibiscus syriacus]|uniref:Uncharacterized protein n=1 Tax=Hibiscus syriacus TaxID=106335 RepID=A0A6A2ZYH0_HIBSY|nr:hypothetical protein F3Y22_tig00110633pilonHSYRG00030 [Hibiscus syriacus]